MAKTPKRRSISLKGLTYQRLKNFCDREGKSISGYCEEILAERLDDVREPIPETVEKPKPRSKKDIDQIVGQHFTF
jgi:hypothetical protein